MPDKKMKNKFLYLAILMFIVFLSLTVSISAKPQQNESVVYRILEEETRASLKDTGPSILVFRDHYEYETFYRTIHINREPVHAPPAVDFTENIIIFLSYGEKRTSGFSIEIRKIFTRGNALVIRTVLRSPPDDSFQSQVITHPYILLQAASEGYKRVELVGETGEILDYTNL
jgi:hypothetical protein